MHWISFSLLFSTFSLFLRSCSSLIWFNKSFRYFSNLYCWFLLTMSYLTFSLWLGEKVSSLYFCCFSFFNSTWWSISFLHFYFNSAYLRLSYANFFWYSSLLCSTIFLSAYLLLFSISFFSSRLSIASLLYSSTFLLSSSNLFALSSAIFL